MLCPGFLYLLQPWSLPGKSLGTKMASMLESTALLRKEDLRLGYVWIGVGIFARHQTSDPVIRGGGGRRCPKRFFGPSGLS